MRDVPETPFFSMVFGVLGGPLLQFKSPLATLVKVSEMLIFQRFWHFFFSENIPKR